MASLEIRIQLLAQHIATTARNLKLKQWDLTGLNTTEKATLVGAINELYSLISSGSVDIDDTTTATDKVWSSSKTQTVINTAIATALEWEDLSDIADQITALMQADNGLVSASSSQTFTDPQKAQARTNINAASATDLSTLTTNIGNTDRNFVTDFDNIYTA